MTTIYTRRKWGPTLSKKSAPFYHQPHLERKFNKKTRHLLRSNASNTTTDLTVEIMRASPNLPHPHIIKQVQTASTIRRECANLLSFAVFDVAQSLHTNISVRRFAKRDRKIILLAFLCWRYAICINHRYNKSVGSLLTKVCRASHNLKYIQEWSIRNTPIILL